MISDKERLKILHEITCDIMGINYELSFIRTRKHKFVEPRQLTMCAAYEPGVFSKGVSLSFIGKFFANKNNPEGYDHATVIHSRKVMGDLIETNQRLKNNLYAGDVYNKIINIYKQTVPNEISDVFQGKFDKKSMLWAVIGR